MENTEGKDRIIINKPDMVPEFDVKVEDLSEDVLNKERELVGRLIGINMKMWIKELYDNVIQMEQFKKLFPMEYKPITRRKRIINRLKAKWQDTVTGCRIIFKGEYPFDGEN